MIPSRGLTQVRSAQKDKEDSPWLRFERIRATARHARTKARPKGRKPGPGCRRVPMERAVELMAVTAPKTRKIYPVTRSHFSMTDDLLVDTSGMLAKN